MSKSYVIAKNENLQLEIEIQGEVLILRPIGQLNEDVNFGNIFKLLADPRVKINSLHIDLKQVSRINSPGVREWLLLVERVQAKLPNVTFLMVNEVMIEQANIVPNIFGKNGTQIVAFEAPYFCPKCNKRSVIYLKTEQLPHDGNGFSAPLNVCKVCASELQFDALEEEYFNFLNHSVK